MFYTWFKTATLLHDIVRELQKKINKSAYIKIWTVIYRNSSRYVSCSGNSQQSKYNAVTALDNVDENVMIIIIKSWYAI